MTRLLGLVVLPIGIFFLVFAAALTWSEGTNAAPVAAEPTPTVIAVVGVGSKPAGVAVNPLTNRVYVANWGGDGGTGSIDVSVIDGSTNTLITAVSTGSQPFWAAVNPITNRIYVANWGSNTVGVIDGATNEELGTPIPVGGHPTGVAANPNNNRIYVCNRDDANVKVIDGYINEVVATIGVDIWPGGVAVNPTTNRIYVANNNTDPYGTLSIIDGATNTKVKTVSIGLNAGSVAVNTTTNRIYVGFAGGVDVVDGATDEVITTVSWNPVGAVAVNPITNRIYAAGSRHDSASVLMIDGATNTKMMEIPVGVRTSGVAVNPSRNRVFVSNYDTNTLSVIQDYPNPVGGFAELPAVAGAGSSGMGGGAYALLGAVGGVLAITVAGTVAAKRRGT